MTAVLCSGCSTVGPTTPVVPGAAVSIADGGTPVVYAAVGASETAGAGADIDRFRGAWPSVFYQTALPRAATMYNLGIGGETTSAAVRDELPRALAVHPTVVTVWLNVDDIIAGVAVERYERDLTTLVGALRQGGGARVLVANVPVLDGLPLVRACTTGEGLQKFAGSCPAAYQPGRHTLAQLDGVVAAYNAAIARVVAGQGAVLVDLHAQGDVGKLHSSYVDEDGFHPSDLGHAAVAAAFAAALKGWAA
jgi:lysophospholipase L1-like esterase